MTPQEAQATCKDLLLILRDNGMEINRETANALLRYWNLGYLLGYYEGIRKLPSTSSRKPPSESSLTDSLTDGLNDMLDVLS